MLTAKRSVDIPMKLDVSVLKFKADVLSGAEAYCLQRLLLCAWLC